MTALLDTSVIVHYLTRDHPSLSPASKDVVEGEANLVVTDLVLAEAAFVLSRVYRVRRAVVIDSLVGLVSRQNIASHPIPKELAVQALLMCRASGRVSFADAFIWASARATRLPVYTADRRFPAEGVDLRLVSGEAPG